MKELKISFLNTKELYTASTRMHKIFCSSNIDDAFLKDLCNNLLSANTEMERALGKNLSSSFTNLLIEADENRDGSYLGFNNYVSAYTFSKNQEKAEAASKVYSIIENIGGKVVSLGYLAETTKLNTLISELEKPEILQALDLFGGTEWYGDLKTDQVAFEQLYQSKTETESKIDFPLVNKAKTSIVKCLRSLLNYVQANSEELKKEQFTGLAQQLDEVTTDITTIARARKTRKEKNGEEKKPL